MREAADGDLKLFLAISICSTMRQSELNCEEGFVFVTLSVFWIVRENEYKYVRL